MDKDASWKVGSIISAIPCVRNYPPAQACNPLSVLRRLWGGGSGRSAIRSDDRQADMEMKDVWTGLVPMLIISARLTTILSMIF